MKWTALLVLLLCPFLSCRPPHHGIVIGSKNFTEQVVLGELLAQQIERNTGQTVDRRFYLAGTYIAQQALLAGRIDGYVEYTGTALTAILKEHPSGDSSEVFNRVKAEYARRFHLLVLPSLGFNNTFALAVRNDDALRLHLQTISDLASHPELRVGVGYEFLERPDGYRGLAQTYGLRFSQSPRVMDLGLLYRALKEHEIDVAVGSNTDAQIAAMRLVVLRDDHHYFPPYDAVPIIRPEILERDARVRSALQVLSGAVSVDDIRMMNYQVDVQHADVKQVVSKFLERLPRTQ
jgi:osmoprotectant transport system substrate-binding protein